ncbi:MAG: prepilin peptidase [Alphaproteobacteria bacterium]|nr:prepilin peptidase [Alphaproteobacteria bacterium]
MISNIIFFVLILAAIACAVMISIADFRRRIIPDAYLFPLMIIGMIVVAFFPWVVSVRDAAIGAAFGYAMAAIVGAAFDYVRRRRDENADTPIGMGDIKLMAAGGVWMGPVGMACALVIACITGGIWGWRCHQKFIPFAPFFLFGGILTLIASGFLVY